MEQEREWAESLWAAMFQHGTPRTLSILDSRLSFQSVLKPYLFSSRIELSLRRAYQIVLQPVNFCLWEAGSSGTGTSLRDDPGQPIECTGPTLGLHKSRVPCLCPVRKEGAPPLCTCFRKITESHFHARSSHCTSGK